MKQFGLFLQFVGTAMFCLFVVALMAHRFSNPEQTETQILIWSLERWWGWAPFMALAGAGLWLASKQSE